MTTLSITELFRDAEQLERCGKALAAADLYKHWIALNPADPQLHAAMFNCAVVQSRTGDKAGAVNTLREAIRLKPDFHPPYINLGRLLEDLGQPGAAVAQWLQLNQKLSAVTGESLRHRLMLLQQIGRVLENNHMDEAAEDALRQSIDLNPDQPEVVQHWIALRQRQCKWPAIVGWDGVSAATLTANISPLSAAVLYNDPLFQLARAASYSSRTIGLPALPPPYHAPRQRPERLKIGYVSSDLREHAVGFGLAEVMELHDRQAFEIHAYYCGIERDDPTKQRIMASVDRWTNIVGLSDDEAAAKINADGIDILIDVNGFTRDARTGVFARRPAPVQVNWFGFPGTMGTPYHHYIIADPYVIPAGNEIYFSEKVLHLPCYQPNDRKREVAQTTPSRVSENLPETGFVFCCLNGSQKNTDPMFAAWMDILKAVPDSVLWLLDSGAGTNERLREMAAQKSIDPKRLCFAPKRPNPQHLARYPLADLFLDTFPYGAHTTASDAMWMGVPVLTVPGSSFASRVCASLVAASGFPELIATGISDYVRRATEIGNNAKLAATLKLRMKHARHSSLLFDTPRLVKELERLYDLMWQDFTEGNLPIPDLRNLDLYEKAALATGPEQGLEPGSEVRYANWLAHRHAYQSIPYDNRLWTRPAQAIDLSQYRKQLPATAPAHVGQPDRKWSRKAVKR